MKNETNLLIIIGEWWLNRKKAKQRSESHSSKLRWLPSPGNIIFTLLIVGLLVWAQTAGALPGLANSQSEIQNSQSTIPYQGRLADADGNPVTDTVNMVFRLYSQASGGAPLWEEQWTGSNGVQVSDGLFNVMLGSLNPIPQAVITGHDNLFLGITAGTDDEMTPRVQLGSVPFAVQALTIPDGSVTTEKIADEAVTHQKQTIKTYALGDGHYVRVQGATPSIVSSFQLRDVPAGDIVVTCTFIASVPSGANDNGTVELFIDPGGKIARTPTHVMENDWDEYVIHGRLQGFAGGDLTLKIVADGERDQFDAKFGAYNSDSRFGRKCTVIAGL